MGIVHRTIRHKDRMYAEILASNDESKMIFWAAEFVGSIDPELAYVVIKAKQSEDNVGDMEVSMQIPMHIFIQLARNLLFTHEMSMPNGVTLRMEKAERGWLVELPSYREEPVLIEVGDDPNTIVVHTWDSRNDHDTDDFGPETRTYLPFNGRKEQGE